MNSPETFFGGAPEALASAPGRVSLLSVRDDHAVSIPELDRLVALLRAAPGVLGARLTEAGFGGATVALCRAGSSLQAAQAALSTYNKAGGRGRIFIPVPTQRKEQQ
jgi:galactokinase